MAMTESNPLSSPLTEDELDSLSDFLASAPGGRAMTLESLDGFFAALICGPQTVLMTEYLPEALGVPMDELEFGSREEAQRVFTLINRHWNHIVATLFADQPWLPLVFEDEGGVARGNDWATGFMRGMGMRRESWMELLNSEDHGGSLIPMMMLAHEHDPDPSLRPAPIADERRDEILSAMAGGLLAVYRYFEPHRRAGASAPAAARTVVRGRPKVGRNDPCPCGSGRKFKHCHGGPAQTLH